MAAKSVAGDFAMKTGADHARNYRQRQREKIARYEGALLEINKYVEYAFGGIVAAPQALDAIGDFARGALR